MLDERPRRSGLLVVVGGEHFAEDVLLVHGVDGENPHQVLDGEMLHCIDAIAAEAKLTECPQAGALLVDHPVGQVEIGKAIEPLLFDTQRIVPVGDVAFGIEVLILEQPVV